MLWWQTGIEQSKEITVASQTTTFAYAKDRLRSIEVKFSHFDMGMQKMYKILP